MRASIQASSKLLIALLLLTGCSNAPAPAPPTAVSVPAASDQAQGAPPAPTTGAADAPAQPQSVEALNNAAFTAIKAGKWAEAIAAATQAVQLDKENASAQFNLGRAYLGAGRAADAVEAFDTASRLTRFQNPDVEYFRGQAAEAAGRLIYAHDIYQTALAELPAPDKEIRAALEAVSAKLKASAPTREQTEKELQAQEKSGGVERLGSTMATLKGFLLGPEGSAPAIQGTTIRDGNGARVITGHTGPNVGQLNEGWSWIQWQEQDRIYLQTVEEQSPIVISEVQFLDGTDGRYLVLRQALAMPMWTRYIMVLKYDPTRPAWIQTDALAAIPDKVGTLELKQGFGRITASSGNLLGFEPIDLKDQGKTLELCDANNVCITAQWDGTRYSLK